MRYQLKLKLPGLFLFAGTLLHIPVALALFEPGVGVGLQYTDNAGLTANNENDDLIALGYVGASLDQKSGPLDFRGTTSLTYENYTDNTFDDQYYFDLNATAGWEMIRDRLNVRLRDFFTQRLSNTIDRSTPNNIEDVNIFNVSPDLTVPVSKVQKLVINPEFSDFYFERSDIDNQQYSLSIDWLYDTSAVNQVGFGGVISKTDFEDEDNNPNFLAKNIHAIVSGRLARTKYKLNLGFTKFDRDKLEDRSAPTGSLDWALGLGGRSEASVYLASDLTDHSFTALDSAITPEHGDINNVQISSDVFRNNILRAVLLRKGATLKSKLWVELRDLDYKETPQDQEVLNLGFKFNYQMRRLVSSGLFGGYKRTERTEQNRTDKQYVVGGEIGYQISRELYALFKLQYQNKDSTDSVQEFSEFNGLVNLVYGYGEVARKKRSGSF
ncbi:uncharacterized protein (PEP-CTERM system associated) [Thiogranum longum]|uniref:Uncharacterized protein (PEP-CTERM system associated) n=1 Tax=Thiogranum longum TaxID=1537524 RepID=A0A4R1H8P1_9GAMM|nr:outer membrane beta-barrel protein [Thiogranum longum]TCK18197.1 uncharacterized protein (PEP-CTERM system associated) [Thiogranum longum]